MSLIHQDLLVEFQNSSLEINTKSNEKNIGNLQRNESHINVSCLSNFKGKLF